jgi:uncharacterized membrane protein
MGRPGLGAGSASRSHTTQRIGVAGLVGMLLTLMVGASVAHAAGKVSITTPYPAVAVAPGTKVSFDLSIETDTAGRVDLKLERVPAGWTAALFGGGFIVDGVQSDGSKATSVRLDVTLPDDATAATQRIDVVATSGSATDRLPLDIRVTPAAAGEVSLTTDFPELKGTSTTAFTFNLTLHNDTAEDLTFGGTATGPAGWTVTAQVSSESQAASAIVKAGSTTPVTVKATPSADVTAGSYPIGVDVSSGGRTAHADLSVEVTGSYTIKLTTPDARLSASASAGSASDLTLVIQNTGTAPITGVVPSATFPQGWTIKFDPETVDIAPQGEATVVAHMTPSGDAIAGDYLVTFKATSDLASSSADIRVTIQTGLLGGAIGLGLIVLVLVGLGWIFLRYGRR